MFLETDEGSNFFVVVEGEDHYHACCHTITHIGRVIFCINLRVICLVVLLYLETDEGSNLFVVVEGEDRYPGCGHATTHIGSVNQPHDVSWEFSPPPTSLLPQQIQEIKISNAAFLLDFLSNIFYMMLNSLFDELSE